MSGVGTSSSSWEASSASESDTVSCREITLSRAHIEPVQFYVRKRTIRAYQKSKTQMLKIKHRMSPKGLCEMISKLNDKQKAAVTNVGFGGLLNLQFWNIDGVFARRLLEKFDIYSCSIKLFNDQILKVEEKDVELTLGLPQGRLEIFEPSTDKYSEEFKSIVSEWKKRWDGKAPDKTLMGNQLLEKYNDGDDWFVRNFIIFVMATFLNGSQDRTCSFKYLYPLMNIRKIRDFNWCRYTITSLITNTKIWKKKPDRFYTGPLAFLLLFYFDRVVFKQRTVPRRYPTLIGWTTEQARKRQTAEIKAGFGKGYLDKRIMKVFDKQLQQPEELVNKIKRVTKKIADDFSELGDIILEGSKILKMKEVIDEVKDSAEQSFSQHSSQEKKTTSNEIPEFDDSEEFYNYYVMNALDAVVEAYYRTHSKRQTTEPQDTQKGGHPTILHKTMPDCPSIINTPIIPTDCTNHD